MVIAPHEGGAANEIICQAHGFVDHGAGGHGTMVSTMLNGQANPSTS